MSKVRTIDVDTRTFVRFWLVILALGLIGLFLWKAMTGLILIGVAAFLAIAIRPLAQRISRILNKEKTTLGSVMAYVLVIGAIVIIIALVGPLVIGETSKFLSRLPSTFEQTFGGWDGINSFGQSLGIKDLQEQIINTVTSISHSFMDNLGNVVMSSVGTISQVATGAILVLVLTLFFSLEGPGIVRDFWGLLEKSYREKPQENAIHAYKHLSERMINVISTYVSRQVMVAILDATVVAIVVLLLSFVFGFSGDLALPMGLIALIFYLIPMFGPILSCGIITLMIFFSSPAAAVIFLVFYIVYAQIENNVIAPKVQGNALNLPATIVLVAIIIGMYMFGLIGAIVAIPIAGCIRVLVEEWPNIQRAREGNISEES